MAYNSAFLSGPEYLGGKGNKKRFYLDTADTLATVIGAGYVSDAALRGMEAGDEVVVRFFDSITAKTVYYGQRACEVESVSASTGAGTLRLEGTVSVTATSDGLTTGIIHDGAKHVVITAGADANTIATLPAPVAGMRITGSVGGTGCELRTVAGSNQTINGVDSDGSQELALAANQFFDAVAISSTAWIVTRVTSTGAMATVNVPD